MLVEMRSATYIRFQLPLKEEWDYRTRCAVVAYFLCSVFRQAAVDDFAQPRSETESGGHQYTPEVKQNSHMVLVEAEWEEAWENVGEFVQDKLLNSRLAHFKDESIEEHWCSLEHVLAVAERVSKVWKYPDCLSSPTMPIRLHRMILRLMR